jgi:hypothetical protein
VIAHAPAPPQRAPFGSTPATQSSTPVVVADFDIPEMSHEFEPIGWDLDRSLNAAGDKIEFDEPIDLFFGLF